MVFSFVELLEQPTSSAPRWPTLAAVDLPGARYTTSTDVTADRSQRAGEHRSAPPARYLALLRTIFSNDPASSLRRSCLTWAERRSAVARRSARSLAGLPRSSKQSAASELDKPRNYR